MKFEIHENNKFSWDGLTGYPYNTKEQFPAASAAFFKVVGSHGRVKSTQSDRVYFVVSGKGEFLIADEKFYVTSKDVIIVPKNTAYDYRAVDGDLELFLVHTPAYDSEAEIKL
jgi:mannose-6-phosphate isomerase-like protein (cupin superfamily)